MVAAAPSAAAPRPSALQSLQRRFGNQGTRALLRARLGAEGERASSAAEAPRSAIERRSEAAGLQTSGYEVISQPGDSLKIETGRASVLQRSAAHQTKLGVAPPIVHEVLRSPGQPLDRATRAFVEPMFGHDFGQVRVHADTRAAESARTVDAHAYTVGRHVVFGAGRHAPQTKSGLGLLAHELTHVLQQGFGHPGAGLTIAPADDSAEREAAHMGTVVARQPAGGGPIAVGSDRRRPTLQRYIAGEHAQFGVTRDALTKAVDGMVVTYKVKSGEGLIRIAAKFGISVQALKDANKNKLKRMQTEQPAGATAKGANVIEGFYAGETIAIPPVVNEATQEALKKAELKFNINGVEMEYGVGIAMGDFYESPEAMQKAPKSELEALAKLIRKEKTGGKVKDPDDWEAVIGSRYLDLAKKNLAHFAPSNPALVDVSKGPHGIDHKSQWEHQHGKALNASAAGKNDDALLFNSFGDHFLTDAFAAGHLFNKVDLMEQFKRNLVVEALSERRHPTKDFAWVDELLVLQVLAPTVLDNLVVKVSHDFLNAVPGGIPVQNAKGDGKDGDWTLSGDDTLAKSPKSLEVGRKAVAQSQLNVLGVSDAFKRSARLDYAALYKKVWDYVPYPSAATNKAIKATLDRLTTPKDLLFKQRLFNLVETFVQPKIDTVVAQIKARLHAVVAWIKTQLKAAADAAINLVLSLISNPTVQSVLRLVEKYATLAKELFSPRLPTLGPGAGASGMGGVPFSSPTAVIEMSSSIVAGLFSKFLAQLDALDKMMQGHATQSRGVVIYGGGSGKDGPGTKASKDAIIYGSFDFAAFMELMDLILLVMPESHDYRKTVKKFREEHKPTAENITKFVYESREKIEAAKKEKKIAESDKTAEISKLKPAPNRDSKAAVKKDEPKESTKAPSTTATAASHQKVEVGQWAASDLSGNTYFMIKYSDGSKRFIFASLYGSHDISNPGAMEWRRVK
jgi:hypothetical protein